MSRRGTQAARAAAMTGVGYQKQRQAEAALIDFGLNAGNVAALLAPLGVAVARFGAAFREVVAAQADRG